MEEIGKVMHYYPGIGVAVVKLSKPLNIGEKIKIQGHTTEIEQKVDSIQIKHKNVPKAKKGDEIGLKVSDRVRENDVVLRLE